MFTEHESKQSWYEQMEAHPSPKAVETGARKPWHLLYIEKMREKEKK